jgi:hypothetical protein
VIRPLSTSLVARVVETALLLVWPRYESVRVELSEVSASELRTPIPKVEAARLTSAQHLLDSFKAEGVSPYLTAMVDDRVVLGPLVERHGAQKVLIDGLHRTLAVHRSGQNALSVLVIEAAVMPPPVARVRLIHEVGVVDRPLREAPFFAGRGLNDFRPSDQFIMKATELLEKEMA